MYFDAGTLDFRPGFEQQKFEVFTHNAIGKYDASERTGNDQGLFDATLSPGKVVDGKLFQPRESAWRSI